MITMSSPNILSQTAQIDAISTQPFPNSKKNYIIGSRPDIRVPMREITLSDTVLKNGVQIGRAHV